MTYRQVVERGTDPFHLAWPKVHIGKPAQDQRRFARPVGGVHVQFRICFFKGESALVVDLRYTKDNIRTSIPSKSPELLTLHVN